jgi:hypothetical protein
VRLRRRPSSLRTLCARGLAERETAFVADLLSAPGAAWKRYVEPRWIGRSYPARVDGGYDGVEAVVIWRCLCFEIWSRHRNGEPIVRGA